MANLATVSAFAHKIKVAEAAITTTTTTVTTIEDNIQALVVGT